MVRSTAGLLTRGVVHTVRHPVATTSYVVGVVRGLAAEGIRMAGGRHHPQADDVTMPRETTAPVEQVEPPAPERVPLQPGERHAAEVAEAEIVEAPSPVETETGEAFVNEPQAVSRESARGEGTLDEAEVDRWQEDAEEALAGEDVPDSPLPDDEPLLDPSVAKQVRSEAETMQRGAQTEAE